MKLMKMAVVLGMAATMAVAVTGCDKDRDEMRPDPDKVISGEHGLQSRDLREMTDKAAPDILQIPEIVNNPTRIVVVMEPIVNKTESEQGRDFTIFVARLKSLLNTNLTRNRIAFIESNMDFRTMQAKELGVPDPFENGSRTGQPTDARIKPQYYLTGTFYERNEGRTRYYFCTFDLVDINTGVQVWEKSYDVRTLN